MSKKNTTDQSNPLVGHMVDRSPTAHKRRQVEDALDQAVAISVDSGFQFPLYQLKEFHDAFDCVINYTPTIVDAETALLRTKLMVSENAETVEAIANQDLLEILDGLVDKLYVTLGTAHTYGLADILPAAFQLVHENNMSKLGPDGKPIKDASGKVVKPEGYVPVDLKPLLAGAIMGDRQITYTPASCGNCGIADMCKSMKNKICDLWEPIASAKAVTCGECDKIGSTLCPHPNTMPSANAPDCYFNKGSDY